MISKFVIIGSAVLVVTCAVGSYVSGKPGQDSSQTKIEAYPPPTTQEGTLSEIEQMRNRVGDEPLRGN